MTMKTSNLDDDEEIVCAEQIEILHRVDSSEKDEYRLDISLQTHGNSSDLARLDRTIWVVTTAALPWMTGTAVNPLVRALLLTRNRPHHAVTLMIPWLSSNSSSQQALYGQTFDTQADQEAWIRNWCVQQGYESLVHQLQIQFWPGVYHHSLGSIFPTCDICELIPDDQDVAILEEPEHLNWFRVPKMHHQQDGWATKFTFVVGILHTNYNSYLRQYGMGTSLLTAPALQALSSLVCKAYCHRLIRLSDSLPSLVPEKEVTANVHGVRAAFFERMESSPALSIQANQHQFAAVYFVGKLIWAKGFETILQLQELYRNTQGAYFAMDIYGTGNDSKSIQRAFFGRFHNVRRQASSDSATSGDADYKTTHDRAAAEIFERNDSLRSRLTQEEEEDENAPDATAAVETEPAASELSTETPATIAKEAESTIQVESTTSLVIADTDDDEFASKALCAAPLHVISDLSKRTLGTGVETAGAAYQLVESALTQGFGAFQKQEDVTPKDSNNNSDNEEGDNEDQTAADSPKDPAQPKKRRPRHPFRLGPALAAYKWRKTPIPARFMGRKDHLELRDTPHYIFLNMSTSEVLCTTSAEALAMGKFVILPKHPSNTFFLQFSNCLAYDNLDDCVEKLQYALANRPAPLSAEDRHKLSWEGAIERLYEAAAVPQGQDCSVDSNAAKFHVETARKSQYVTNLFNGTLLGG